MTTGKTKWSETERDDCEQQEFCVWNMENSAGVIVQKWYFILRPIPSNSFAFDAENESPELTRYVLWVKFCIGNVDNMLSISAVCPPLPSTTSRCDVDLLVGGLDSIYTNRWSEMRIRVDDNIIRHESVNRMVVYDMVGRIECIVELSLLSFIFISDNIFISDLL